VLLDGAFPGPASHAHARRASTGVNPMHALRAEVD
jgi:hypothetical protein